jgi:hypothetical protein
MKQATDTEINKMNKLQLVSYMMKLNPLKPIFTKRYTTKQLREQAKKMTKKS